MKKQAEAAQAAAGEVEAKADAKAPARAEAIPGRNDLVTITNGTATETMKFKKAEDLLKSGEWKVISK
jgi:hypothetical protein